MITWVDCTAPNTIARVTFFASACVLGRTSVVASRHLGTAPIRQEWFFTIARVYGCTLAAIALETLAALARVHGRCNILANGIIGAVIPILDGAVVDDLARLAITRVTHIASTCVLCEARFGARGIARAAPVLNVTVLDFFALLSITRVMSIALAVPFTRASVLAGRVCVATR
jgi:hypothetical protein